MIVSRLKMIGAATIVALLTAYAGAALGQTPDLCGRSEVRGELKVRVQCIDYPAMRKLTGATMFPDERGQQVWVRSEDATVRAYRISLTYRKAGKVETVVQFSDAHPTYDSGGSWVLGDVELLAVEVSVLRAGETVALQ